MICSSLFTTTTQSCGERTPPCGVPLLTYLCVDELPIEDPTTLQGPNHESRDSSVVHSLANFATTWKPNYDTRHYIIETKVAALHFFTLTDLQHCTFDLKYSTTLTLFANKLYCFLLKFWLWRVFFISQQHFGYRGCVPWGNQHESHKTTFKG